MSDLRQGRAQAHLPTGTVEARSDAGSQILEGRSEDELMSRKAAKVKVEMTKRGGRRRVQIRRERARSYDPSRRVRMNAETAVLYLGSGLGY